MVNSMTAFARKEQQTELGRLSCEIRSVNHRYLDISFRLPDNMRQMEIGLRERLAKVLKRGKLDISLRLQDESQTVRDITINPSLLKQLHQAANRLHQQWHSLQAPTWLDLLRWPGLLEENTTDEEKLRQSVAALMDETVAELQQSRGREGARLQTIIEERLVSMQAIIERVTGLMPAIIQQNQERLITKLQEIKAEIDQSRLEQELVYFANRMDIDEELQRLRVHIDEIKQTLQRNEPIGRRMDFLMQELNREANTLGSKSAAAETSNAAVELKVLIEQMREQVQNIE